MSRQVSSCGVALLLVLGGLVLSAPASAQTGYKPCSLVSVSETEVLAGEKVAKSVESTIPYKRGTDNNRENVRSICQRLLTGNRTFLLIMGVMTKGYGDAAEEALGKQSQEKIRKMGGTWESKQFGEVTCATVVVPSNSGFGNTTCVAEKGPLFLGDGFDNTTSAEKGHLFFVLQITAGPNGIVPMDRVHELAEEVLARMP